MITHTLSAASTAAWPRVWSTEDDADLQTRLSRIPFYAPAGFGDTAPSFGGVQEDIATLAAKGPTLLTKLVTLVNKAGPYLDTGIKIVEKGGPYLPTVLQVVEDPAFPTVVARVKTIRALQEQKRAAAAARAKAGLGATAPADQGVGLYRTIPVLDAYIYTQKNPWAPWAVTGGIAVALGGIGFALGRWSKRCKTATAVGARRRSRR